MDIAKVFSEQLKKNYILAAINVDGLYCLTRADLDFLVNLNHIIAFSRVEGSSVINLASEHCMYYCFEEDLKNTSFSFVLEEV